MLAALDIVLDHERSRREWLPITPDLSFASEQWHRTVLAERDGQLGILRRHLEVCVFSYLASELKTGDVFVIGSEGYADYREQLLPWAQCEPQVAAYCRELGFPETAKGFVQQLQEWLTHAAEEVDRAYPENGQLVITDKGEPVLKRLPRQPPVTALASLEAAVAQRLPERSVLDVLANVEHWLHWTRHFGPLSGTEPKLDDPVLRYILTTFGYGCNLGPGRPPATPAVWSRPTKSRTPIVGMSPPSVWTPHFGT